jgi:maleylpyruvate isomerase
MARSLTDSLAWVAVGTDLFSEAMGAVDEAYMNESSTLPGWTRAHVVAHVTGNARGLINLVTWARTGVETPMYSSAEQRIADIEAGAALPAPEQRDQFKQSSADLALAFEGLSDAGWTAEVRTIQGRTLPASEIPWLRAREVMIHAVDLDGDVGFDRMPADFVVALTDDIVQRRSSMDGHPAVVLEAPEHRWVIGSEDDAVVVAGTPSQIAAYLSGRGPLGPELPAWL